MGSEQPILLQPGCPAADDPEVLTLLERLAATIGVDWLELELELPASGESQSYRVGERAGTGARLELPLDGRFSARLCLPEAEAPGVAVAALVAVALRPMLASRRLREQVALLQEALDTTRSALLLFDPGGDIVYANPPADELLSRQTEDGLLVVGEGGGAQPLFGLIDSVVEQVANGPGMGAGWQGTLTLAGDDVLACEVIRVSFASEGCGTCVLALLQPIEPGLERRLEAFVAEHGLSAREGDVVGRLAEGLGTPEIAERLGISAHTVRDHLKRIYRKTGWRSRTELLGRLTRSAARLTAGAGRRPSGAER